MLQATGAVFLVRSLGIRHLPEAILASAFALCWPALAFQCSPDDSRFAYAGLLLLIAPTFQLFSNPHVMELLLGAVLAWPLAGAALASVPPQAWLKRTDNLLGRLAYPIFISHFLAFYLCEKLFGLTSTHQYAYIPVAIVLCLSLSYGLLRMQDGVDAYRLRRRGFQSMAMQSA